MKFLMFLKVLFLIGVVAIVAADAFIVINFCAGTVIPPVIVVILVSVGLVGIISGICWYVKKEALKKEEQ
ncbi:MAG: hypothetical protein IJY50_09590 [Clostridia bacterium]|nr:hypothetical protein [Clostridia bacterium]